MVSNSGRDCNETLHRLTSNIFEMEAVGSRLGRASSRYGAPAVFSGPVRKWKKKWVHVYSPTSTFHNSHSNPHSNNNNNNNGGSHLLLCRWTPITTPSSAPDDASNSSGNVSEEPPRRKFRYTPVAVLEEQKKVAIKKPEYELTTESDQLTAMQANVTQKIHGKLNMNEISKEAEDSGVQLLDLGLGFEDNNDEIRQNSDDQLKSSGWSMN